MRTSAITRIDRRPILLFALAALSVSLTSCGTSAPPASSAPAYTNANLSGTFVFSASGSDPTDGAYYVAGTFTADGKGNITGGTVDYTESVGVDPTTPFYGTFVDPRVSITGTYSVGSTGSGTATITDGAGVKDTFTFYLASSTSPQGISGIQAFDGTGSGQFLPIGTPPADLSGSYSFSLSGQGQGTVSASGSFQTNASGSILSGSEMYTDSGATSNYASLSGFLSPAVNGRGYAVIGPNTFGYYLNSLNQITLVGLDDRVLLYGTAQKSS